MLLSYHELRQEVQARGYIAPIEDSQVNGSSIDVRLGSQILVERKSPEGYTRVSLRDRTPLAFDTVDIGALGAEPFVLPPGGFVLAHTIEKFNLPLDMSVEFRLNSSGARMGLSHALAVWMDTGWHGSVLTLELHNISQQHEVVLHYGDRIGQVIFHRHAKVPRDRSYAVRGAYNADQTVMAAKKAATVSVPRKEPRTSKPWEV